MTAFIALVAQTDARGSGVTFLISIVLLIGIFYFLLIRPQQRRMRQQRELIESLAVGDEVITIGGAFGTVTDMDDESVTIRMQPEDTKIRFVRNAIARRFVAESPEGS